MVKAVSSDRFQAYCSEIQQKNIIKSALVDSNLLIAVMDSSHSDNSEANQLIDIICGNDMEICSTVTIKTEILDYFRRRFISRGILTHNVFNLLRTNIQKELNETLAANNILTDSQIKLIRSRFSVKYEAWLELCTNLLLSPLDNIRKELEGEEANIKYVSPYKDKEYFLVEELPWKDMIDIVKKTAIGVSDAMIINSLNNSNFPFIVSNDLDIGYAMLATENINKDVVMTNSQIVKLKRLGFQRSKFF